jgi:Ser/Thr protein kinase RdoA (MazF antagonist)
MPTDSHLFTRLTPDLVMDAVESVGFRCDARILELNSYENRVYQIGIEDETPIIGKFYRPDRWTDAQILEEHNFTLELAAMDVSAVPPIKLGDTTLDHHDDFRFALYPRRGGRAPDLDILENLEILGRHIGRIHAIGSDHPFAVRPAISVVDYGVKSRELLLAGNFIPLDLVSSYEAITTQLLDELQNCLARCRYIRLHGDCHMGNILWRDDLPHFVDFDDARNGPAIQDLWMMLSGTAGEQSTQMSYILDGYTAFSHFDRSEISLIEPLRTLRIMYHAAWIARRWDDPAFPRAFPFFDTQHYWASHVQELRDQWERINEPPLSLY